MTNFTATFTDGWTIPLVADSWDDAIKEIEANMADWYEGRPAASLRSLSTAPPTIQIITYRDPDASTELSVFLDGRRLSWDEFVERGIDPGHGWSREDWDELITAAEVLPPSAFRDELLQGYESYSDNEYIED
ncbi:hypothetical protein HOT75_gp137 [Gordonia phage Daredevil]|uniref:Uncharacterized protein n=1 Tax=Gordonia phage Daredevil TaxID=2283286 RepID=A0A345MIZ2_9CAUD|nr:hypothetical protein HOT75_gp137 [Gordonia phage Daredevil]AXH70523.1 hypothetical protein SEA_DAREDEVIL_137 [Gordonia phage Daredevil]